MAFLKNRISLVVISILVLFAFFGLVSWIAENPIGLLKNLAVFLVIGFALWLIFRSSYKANPEKKEQRAFVKAAKKSKKRWQFKEKSSLRQVSGKSINTGKAKKHKRNTSAAHLTVIEGKKGKKKNRASL
ncbi:MAG: SA1362 family protein [Bacillus sp. (in: firmicutes)]